MEFGPWRDRVEHGSVLLDILVQQLQARIALVGIDQYFVADLFHARWDILADTMDADLHALQPEMQDRRHSFDPLVDRPAFRRHPGAIIHGNHRGVYGQQQAVHGRVPQ